MNDDVAYSVAVDASGNTYMAGYFWSITLTFSSTTLTNAGGYDIFLAKSYGSIVTGINELSNSLNISVFPNPLTDNITIIIPCLAGRQAQKAIIEILNIEGQIIKTINNIRREKSCMIRPPRE